MMNMTFHFSDKIMGFLFEGCNIMSWLDMTAAMGAVFLTAVILVLLKLLDSKLKQMRRKNPLESQQKSASRHKGSINGHDSSQSSLLASLRIPSSVSKIRHRRLKFHAVESILHLLQVALGYILMLVVMTYNAYIFITVVLSLTVGYFFLAPVVRMREPRRVPARHESLTDSEARAYGGSCSSPGLVDSTENVQNPNYGSLYQ